MNLPSLHMTFYQKFGVSNLRTFTVVIYFIHSRYNHNDFLIAVTEICVCILYLMAVDI